MEALDGPQGTLPPLKELTIVSDWTRMPFHKSPNDPAGIDVRIGLLPPSLDAFSHYFLMNVQRASCFGLSIFTC
ncbi:hypothetical protein POTOM_056819 [Populus tomentosa]|uniref:Uncharacterized protein n=1 Tax=Populus tomentosa TaxID=118781 RepID=A0A8X7XS33_POPTO|nr:hypothetical protein POTOM_056819 [Populus tomentosa]